MINSIDLKNVNHQKNYEHLMNKYSSYEPYLLQAYFECLFKTYSPDDVALPYWNFYKFLSWPFFLGEKLYNYFKKNEEDTRLLRKERFTVGLSKLYGHDSLEAKADILFEWLAFKGDGIIHKKDMVIVLAQFMVMSDVSNVNDCLHFIHTLFDGLNDDDESSSPLTQMTLEQYKDRLLHRNADAVYLMLLLFYKHKPFDDKSIDYFSQLIYEGGDQNANTIVKTKTKASTQLIAPTNELFAFLASHMEMQFTFEENDLDALENFEESVTSIISSALRGNNMISNQDETSASTKNAFSGLVNFKKSMNSFNCKQISRGLSHASEKQIIKKTKIKQSKSQELSLNSLLRKPVGGNKPFVISCFEVSKRRVMVKRKIVIIAKDIFFFKYCNESNVKLSHIFPLRDVYLRSGPTEDLELNDIASLVLIITHQHKLVFKSLFFSTEPKRDKLKEKIISISLYRNVTDEYKIIQCIGKGTFGTIVRAEHKKTKKQVALKILDKPSEKDRLDLLEIVYRERDISNFFKIIHYKGIIQIKDIIETINNIIIVQEFIPAGNLNQYSNHVKLSIEQSYEVINQLIHTINFMHSLGIIHRDIKTDNILISHTQSGHLQTKLIDFSLSTILGCEETINGACGTLIYLPPEMLLKRPYSASVDIWTLGVIGYYLITGLYPFESVDPSELANQIICKDVSVLLNSPAQSNTKRALIKVILSCLQKDQSMRAKISELTEFVSRYQ